MFILYFYKQYEFFCLIDEDEVVLKHQNLNNDNEVQPDNTTF